MGTAKPYCTMQFNRQINKQFMQALIGPMNYLLIHPVRMDHAAQQVDQRPFAEPGDLHVSKTNPLIRPLRNPMNRAPQGINGLIKHSKDWTTTLAQPFAQPVDQHSPGG